MAADGKGIERGYVLLLSGEEMRILAGTLWWLLNNSDLPDPDEIDVRAAAHHMREVWKRLAAYADRRLADQGSKVQRSAWRQRNPHDN